MVECSGRRALSVLTANIGADEDVQGASWAAIVELLSDAVFLVGPDRRIVFWNRAAEVLTGYRRDEVVGKDCLEAIHCENCERRCGVFELGGASEVPLVLRDREGRAIEVVKNATVLATPEGKVKLGIEVLRDVTASNERERRSIEAQHEAEAQQRLLRHVLDGATDGILGVGADLRVRFVSAAAERALGVAEEQAVGRTVAEIAGAEAARMVTHVLSSGGRVNPTKVGVKTPDGRELPVSMAASPMELPDEASGVMVLVHDLQEEDRRMRERLRSQGYAYGALVSKSPRMQEVFDLVDQVAPTSATILVQGESGTGKELIAREIHRRSRRAAGPFHAVSCAAIAPEILESEFFGHEKGAFTGAVVQKRGRFEVAHTGTIFLDEVGELPLSLQAKLLRVLEERAFERVGGTETISVDVRVVAATNRDLAEMVREGKFREDLFYRLRVVPVRLPSLRERMEDVEALAQHFLRRIADREGRPVLAVDPSALRALLDHDWPGNVRELANVLEYAAVVARGAMIGLGDLPRELRTAPECAPPRAPSVPPAVAALRTPERVPPTPSAPRGRSEVALAYADTAEAPPAQVELGALRLSRDELEERAQIEATLAATHWAHGEAAKRLGMHRTTLYRKRLRYGL